MAVFSKPMSIQHSCYEVGHCWTPYCRKATQDIATHMFKESLKIYGALYLVAALVKKRGLKYYIYKLVPETVRSSLFLSINGGLYVAMFCLWRRALGSFFFVMASFLPAYIAAATAIICERKSRRGPLALYLTNLAVETGFRMLVERNLVTPVRNGEVYLFSAASAVYLYLFRKQDGLSAQSKSLFKFFLGGAECGQKSLATSASQSCLPATSASQSCLPATSVSQTPDSQPPIPLLSTSSQHSRTCQSPQGSLSTPATTPTDVDRRFGTTHIVGSTGSTTTHTDMDTNTSSQVSDSPSPVGWGSVLQAALHKWLQQSPLARKAYTGLEGWLRCMLSCLDGLPAHSCCPHNHSCISYVVKGGLRMFSLGYLVQAVLTSVSLLPILWKKPLALNKTLLSTKNLGLAAFLGGYCSVYRAVNCVLRWIRTKDSEVHGAVAGAAAGLCLGFYKSVTLALYAATKLMEILYFKGIKDLGLPHIHSADVLIYAFSTAFVLHAAMLEPHTLRPGYWKFLLRITNNRFAFMNRKLLDVFGVQSSKIQPDYWPDYDPRFSSLTR